MQYFPEYLLQTLIHESRLHKIYRGVRRTDNTPVILKILKNDFPGEEQITKLTYEYKIISHAEGSSEIITPVQLLKKNKSYAIVFEDIGGLPLNRYSKRTIGISQFLKIALKTVRAVEQIHRKNIIHNRINPSHFIYNEESGELRLIDFSNSSRFSTESKKVITPERMINALPYISPEQTGRMNRNINYRSDFFSLGATFYTILTGKVPFESTDIMEMIYSHIAINPVPPHLIKPSIPEMLSVIVLKLMQKNAEDRYASAAGLGSDLNKCLQLLEDTGSIPVFTPGKDDVPSTLTIPRKLYGRKKESETLMDIFDKAASGSKELIFITGRAGTGKSAVIYELFKPLTAKRLFFITGTYDQFEKNLPYSAVIQAFRDLVRQLLTTGKENFKKWRKKIKEQVGTKGKLITEVIPEIKHIIGEQPPVEPLPPTETINRFEMVFQQFMECFIVPDRPLVLFLDNLQWADPASLKLLKVFLTDPELINFMLIGAYRDNEVTFSHALTGLLGELESANISWTSIRLEDLKKQQIKSLLSETLFQKKNQVDTLAALVKTKTGGNPFFVKEFIMNLHLKNLISFDKQWQWDLNKINDAQLTDNVIQLMLDELEMLPGRCREILKKACCIGTTFEPDLLAELCEKEVPDIYKEIEPAITGHLIMKYDNEIGFIHDRIRKALYSLLSEEEKNSWHHKIGTLLINRKDEQAIEEDIFLIVNQLNLVKKGLTGKEKEQLLELNIKAGSKAKLSTAYGSAAAFFQKARELLPDDCWDTCHSKAFLVYKELSEALFLQGNLREAEPLFYFSLEKAGDREEKVELYHNLIQLHTHLAKYDKALEAAARGLKLLHITFPHKDKLKEAVKEGIIEIYELIGTRKIADLISLPKNINKDAMLALRLLNPAHSPAYILDFVLLAYITILEMKLILKHGITKESSFTVSVFGLIIRIFSGKYQKQDEFGTLSLKLADTFNDNYQKGWILYNKNYSDVWNRHISYTKKSNNEAYRICLDSGNFYIAALSLASIPLNSLYYLDRDNLETVLKKTQDYLEFSLKKQKTMSVDILKGTRLILANLLGKSDGFGSFDYEELSEKEYIRESSKNNSNFALAHFYLLKAMLLYLYDLDRQAYDAACSALEKTPFILGTYCEALITFYHSLTLCRMAVGAKKKQKNNYLADIENNQEKLKLWSGRCPENFLNKYLLVEAEKAKITGNTGAFILYGKAIKEARKNGFINEEAMANELFGRYSLENDLEQVARLCITEAFNGFKKWGACKKVTYMLNEYKNYIYLTSIPDTKEGLYECDGEKETKAFFDLNLKKRTIDISTLIKSSQALSGEITVRGVVEKLIQILIENIGARKGILILKSKNEFLIKAEGIKNNIQVYTDVEKPWSGSDTIPREIVSYVLRTKETVVLDDAREDGRFQKSSYIIEHDVKSVMCTPILRHGELKGLIYLENELLVSLFSHKKLELIKTITAQCAISIENAGLYEELKELEKIVNRSPVIVFLWKNAPGWPVQYVSDNIDLFGYHPDDFYSGKVPFSSLVHPDDLARVGEEVGYYSTEGYNDFTQEYRIITESGETRWIDDRTWIRRDKQGTITHYQGIIMDINSKKKAEREISTYQEQLEELVKERTEELNHKKKEIEDKNMKLKSSLMRQYTLNTELIKKNKKINENIDYARRIQISILPKRERNAAFIKDYFIIWKPRDVVGGDFYWFKETAGGFLLALADCTGHGVSGAFMTMIAYSELNRIADEVCDNNPALILSELNSRIKRTLNKDARDIYVDDGLDIGILYYKKDDSHFIFSGANIPLFIINHGEVTRIKADKQSIGYIESKEDFNYINHRIQIVESAVFYLLSDGFVDQIGGKKGLPFGNRRLESTLKTIYTAPLAEQKRRLLYELRKYRGSKYSQIDDIAMIGFTLTPPSGSKEASPIVGDFTI